MNITAYIEQAVAEAKKKAWLIEMTSTALECRVPRANQKTCRVENGKALIR